jgi:adenylate cyclase
MVKKEENGHERYSSGTLTDGTRRLAAIVFTDIVGYTGLTQSNEALAMRLLSKHRELLRPIFPKYSGREVKTIGDAFLLEFDSALEATECAVELQKTLHEYNQSTKETLLVRVGVHVGDVIHREGDVYGDAVNIASRIEPLASGGGICVSEQVYDQVRNKIPYKLIKLQTSELKNVKYQIDAYKLELPWEKGEMNPVREHDKHRLAVLPLANMSADPADEYFADGMTEELISAVSGISGLSVISRTSVMEYKGKGRRIAEVGDELNVGTVLEGSVRRAGDRLRVTAQLIDVEEDRHLWSEKYDRELDDVFKIQDDIAGKIAQALRVKLASIQELGRKQTENVEAYTLYLKGRYFWNKRSKEGIFEAMKLFQEAINIDPNYARAYSGLADAYHIAADYDFMDMVEGKAKAREMIMKALGLDDTLAEAHASFGLDLLGDLHYQEAQREFRRAIGLNPSYATAHHWLSNCLADLGNLNDAIDEIEKAHELDPLSPIINGVLSGDYEGIGRLDEALAILDKLIESEPTWGYYRRCYFFMITKVKDRAFADLEAWYKLDQDEGRYKWVLASLYGWFGDKEKALHLIRELQGKEFSQKHTWLVALSYAILGEKDAFFAWVDKAIGLNRVSVWDLRYSPFWDKVRNDPRFPNIFKRLGLPY